MKVQTLTHRFIEANCQTFHVAMAGPDDGPLIMLLHGFPECWYAWRHQVDALVEAGWCVAMPDQRGYGTSSKPPSIADYQIDILARDVVALANTLGRRKFCLVGHDWGGIVAWQVAATFPEHVERLAILNAPRLGAFGRFAWLHPTQLFKSAYVGFFQIPDLPEATLAAGNFYVLKQALRSSSRAGTFSSAELAIYQKSWAEPRALRSMLNWYRALPSDTAKSSRTVMPTLVLWGDRDTALDARLAEASFEFCGEGEVIHIAGATHWLHHEEAELVNAELVRFCGTDA